MKAISKYFAMCAIALLGLANTSCMSDDIESTPSCDFKVVLDYKVGSSTTETRAAVTRAEEVGKADLNENLINRLDLFVFEQDGSRVKQVTFNSEDVKGSSPTTDYKHKELTSNELTRSDIDGNKQLYLVANLEKWGNINNLADLQKATIKQAAFQHNQKQDAFVMDAKMLDREVTAGKIHLKFQLKRALAKIRLNVKDDKGNTVDPTKYACQLIHYAADGSILAEGTSTSNELNTDAAASSKVTVPAVTQDDKAVFYSYANNWINKSKDPKAEEPIDVNKQTYILLKAKYNNKDYYFYKVPVNKRLYESNDAATIDWANYEPLYRLDRNTIYDVTAKVDREGGSDPEHPAELNVLPTVLPWETGANYTFNDAISIKTKIEKNGENSSKIAFNNATFGPKISFTEMNTNGKSWVLQTDSPDYGFIYADKVKANGSYDLNKVMTVITGNGATTEVKPFYVVPRSVLDYTQRDNYTCHVYMVAYSPNMKVIINAPSDGSEGTATGTGTKTDMEFTQVK